MELVTKDLPIVVRGAREHNLQNVDLTLARNQLICFTGVSGSGKSSLAFDTLYAEGQRRYLESLSTYARQFVGQMPKPDVDLLSGLCPSISISQKSTGNNPRSTVGTITEIHDFLRVLFSRVGTGFCPNCQCEITSQTRDQMVEKILALPVEPVYLFLAPLVRGQKGEYRDLFDDLRKQGFNRARIDGTVYLLSEAPALARHSKHHIELVVDRISLGQSSRQRIAEAVDLSLKMGEGTMLLAPMQAPHAKESGSSVPAVKKATRKKKVPPASDRANESDEPASSPGRAFEDIVFSSEYACAKCGTSYPPPSPQLLSFNSPQGACSVCEGLGESFTFDPELLVTKPEKSIKNGAIELIGKLSDATRWYRRSIQFFASIIEAREELTAGRLLTTQWNRLTAEEQNWLLDGYNGLVAKVKGKASHGELFNGIIPELLNAYRACKIAPLRNRYERHMQIGPCAACHGSRLNDQARSLRLQTKSKVFQKAPWRSIDAISRLSIAECSEFFAELSLTPLQLQIGHEAIREIQARLKFLLDVGLGYLSLSRTAPTLSGGESQRIRLASQIGSGLVGVLYVLDEPSIGLHPRDNDRLLDSLRRLRDLGNTLIVVEHDEDTMRIADTIVDFGPGPGVRGGKLLTAGTIEEVSANPESLTGQFLNRTRTIQRPDERRPGNGKKIKIVGAAHNNLKDIDVEIPLGCFVAVTGVSGSGKSSLITDILSPALAAALQRGEAVPGKHNRIDGIEHLDKIIDVDQSPIGRTPRSNPATYVKVFDEIRDLFAELPESKRRGFTPGTFSFNTEQGRCTACDGHGANRLDMEFLADLWVPCAVCEGRRYARPTLQVEFKGKSIADCLDLDVQQAVELFEAIPKIREKLQTLCEVGLDYLKLGQPSPTLSGGEAQRIKLSKELSRRATGKTVYVLDEPTTGLHFHDIDLLLGVLQRLVDRGNTVIVVEHNLDLIQAADWIIDLGPEGGELGGWVIGEGTPETLAKNAKSHTGMALAKYFESHHGKPSRKKKTSVKKTAAAKPADRIAMEDIQVTGAQQHNLRNVDLVVPRNKMTVFSGQSGSGKTSMAMDTIYAEGQRRFVESLSPYVRQFVGQMPKANVARIDGLSPAIAIEQRNLSHTPRSTVGTVTEIYDYLRVLFARLGKMHCTQCDQPVSTQTSDQIVDRLLEKGKTWEGRALLLAPVDLQANQDANQFMEGLKQQGFVRMRINGKTYDSDNLPSLQSKSKNNLQVVVDRLQWNRLERSRLSDSVTTALGLGNGVLQIAYADDQRDEVHWDVETMSLQLACNPCGVSFQPLTPHNFSFNTAIGWCESCSGLGTEIGPKLEHVFDLNRSLEEGGALLWPNGNDPLRKAMLRAFCRQTGIPIDVPLGKLSIGQRAVLLRGLPDREIVIQKRDLGSTKKGADRDTSVYMSFRFRGFLSGIEQASVSEVRRRLQLNQLVRSGPCPVCSGARVRPEAARVRFRDRALAEIVQMPIKELVPLVRSWTMGKQEKKVAGELHREISQRLQFLADVGLEYLTLDRAANTLSGGESQRIRLASQLGSGLSGVLYVLDEPTIGLHPRDNDRLIRALKSLRDLGNTLLVVEHDREVIANSDQLCDFGPGAGVLGGNVVAQGTPAQIKRSKESVTGPYLSGRKTIEMPLHKRIAVHSNPSALVNDWSSNVIDPQQDWLEIYGAKCNSLKRIDVRIPFRSLTAITGPSGSGKSSLANQVITQVFQVRYLEGSVSNLLFEREEGARKFCRLIRVDQSSISVSPASNPATYIGVFDHIRALFARIASSQGLAMTSGSFSHNVDGGRCEKCEGIGQVCIQMHFLPDVWVQCESCQGKRFTEEVLQVKYRGKSIFDVLEMSIGEARELFSEISKIQKMLDVLCQVGLDYLPLGASAARLSGGEAQRVKLASELVKRSERPCLYMLDEPTTGLHFDDIAKLMKVLQSLVDAGHTVVVIEHNLDVIKCADWVVDLGPEAGDEGGQVVFAGPPEKLVTYAKQHAESRETNGAAADGALLKVAEPQKPTTKSRKKTAPVALGTPPAAKAWPVVFHRSYTGEALAEVLPNE